MAERLRWILLTALILLGIYLRSSGTFHGFFAFTFDQGRDFLDLYRMAYEGDMRLIGPPTGIDGVFHGVWWHWFLLPIFWLTRGNPTAVVLTFNIFSSAVILLAYYLGKVVKNPTTGILMAGLTTLSSYFIGIGAQLWHPNVVPLIVLVALLAAWLVLNKKLSYFWVGFLLGMIFEFEFASGGLLVIAFVAAFLILRIPLNRKSIFVSVLGFLFWLAPRFVFELRNHFIQTRSFIKYIQTSSGQADLTLIERLGDRLRTAFFITKDAFASGDERVGVILISVVLVVLYRYIKSSPDDRRLRYIRFIILVLLFLLTGTILYPGNLWNYYLVSLPALVLVLTGFAFGIIMTEYSFSYRLLAMILFMFMVSPWKLISSPWEGDAAVFRNQLRVVDTIFQDNHQQSFNVQVYSPSVIDYSYHYLFLWRGQTRYGLVPDREEIQPVVYYIIEPDKWHPVLREAWLRERIGDGTIAWEKEFPGGIEVEKRVR